MKRVCKVYDCLSKINILENKTQMKRYCIYIQYDGNRWKLEQMDLSHNEMIAYVHDYTVKGFTVCIKSK